MRGGASFDRGSEIKLKQGRVGLKGIQKSLEETESMFEGGDSSHENSGEDDDDAQLISE